MSDAVTSRLQAMEHEHADLEARLADPAVASDPAELRRVSVRYRELTPLVDAVRRRRALDADAAAARELLARGHRRRAGPCSTTSSPSAEPAIAAVDERAARAAGAARSQRRAGRDRRDPRRRGRRGGQPLRPRPVRHVRRLRRPPRAGRSRRCRRTRATSAGSTRSRSPSPATSAWRRFKFEGGPHRVQRVPVTESQGRIHTSSATVLVLAEAEEVEVADRRPATSRSTSSAPADPAARA